MDILRDGGRKRRTTSSESAISTVLELTYNHDGRAYDNGTGYGHIALAVDDLDATLARTEGAGHRAGATAVSGKRGRHLHLLRSRPGRLPHRAHRPRELAAAGEYAPTTGLGGRSLALAVPAWSAGSHAVDTFLPLREPVARVAAFRAERALRLHEPRPDARTGSTSRTWTRASCSSSTSARGEIVKTIPAPGVHGVIAVPQLGRVYASATDAHQALTIDARHGRVLARAPAGQYPDGLAYDPVERHVFVSDESGGVETVLNAAGHRIATISLGGEAGNVQYDAGSGHVLVDVQTRDDIAVIDPRTNRIVRRVAAARLQSRPRPLIDSTRRLAFVACDGNATLLTLDLRTMKVTGRATSAATPTCSPSTARCAGSTSRPRAATSPSSPRPRTASRSSGKRSSRRRRTPSPSTRARTSSTSRSRAARTAARSC